MKELSIVVVAMSIAIAQGIAQEHGQAQPDSSTAPSTRPALTAPSSIRTKHKHLHDQLEAAIAAAGKTGERARRVAAVLVPHFEEEDAYAMPPLGLPESLAQGKPVSKEEARSAIEMADRLRSHYYQMIEEHKQINEALRALALSAQEERKPDQVAFAEALMMNAQNEEQVLTRPRF